MSNNKKVFARLLAREDIAVVSSATAKTASFNLVNRVITFPVYKDMTEENLNGFTAHEVGHARHTDPETYAHWSKSYGSRVANVIEDLRCNNIMKKEFSGVSNIFNEHYSQLKERKFFGDLNKEYGFLDKINLANKLRINMFSDEEIEFWNEFGNIQSEEDGELACKYVFAYYKDKKQEEENETHLGNDDSESEEGEDESEEVEQDNNPDSDPTEDEENSDDSEEGEDESEEGGEENSDDSEDGEEGEEDNNDSAPTGEDESEEGEENSDDSEEGESEDDAPTNDGNDNAQGESDSEDDFDPESIECETEDEFENQLENSIEEDREAKQKQSFALPRTKDLRSDTVPYNHVRVKDKDHLNNSRNYNNGGYWRKFNDYKKKVVNRMVSTFNRHKSAQEFHRRRYSDSGSLNMNKLTQYKTSSNIFLKNMKIAEGENHGVVFFLDTSGSMSGQNGIYTVKQIAIMTDFCRKLHIPYSVVGFSYQTIHRPREYKNDNNVLTQTSYNVELLSHKLNDGEHEDRLYALWKMFQTYGWSHLEYTSVSPTGEFINVEYSKSMTPLYSTIINSVKFVDDFKKKNNVQVMNVMYFTDGEDTDGLSTVDGDQVYTWNNIVDVETKKEYSIEDYRHTDQAWCYGHDHSKSLLLSNIVKDRFNCNVFFMYIPIKGTYGKMPLVLGGVNDNDTKAKSKWTREYHKNTFFQFANQKGSKNGVEAFALYVGKENPREPDFDKIKKDDSGEVSNRVLNALSREIKASAKSQAGSFLFADIVAQKVAEGA